MTSNEPRLDNNVGLEFLPGLPGVISTESQMVEFQQIVDGVVSASRRSSSHHSSTTTTEVTSSPPTSPAASEASASSVMIVRSDEDGYLHSEVGIDQELERLLAENPGLYMEDSPPKSIRWPSKSPSSSGSRTPRVSNEDASAVLHIVQR
jgi:hypothetical protein